VSLFFELIIGTKQKNASYHNDQVKKKEKYYSTICFAGNINKDQLITFIYGFGVRFQFLFYNLARFQRNLATLPLIFFSLSLSEQKHRKTLNGYRRFYTFAIVFLYILEKKHP